ncbi:MAG: LPS export ABC transporter periplasmic protein LptC [Bacteroidales bacterium]|nr:LPS export ABC transporter periplasmic protein LptC [Bacteroidales bacterium]
MLLLFASCSGKEVESNPINYEEVPMQTVEKMRAIQYDMDVISMEMRSARMERYAFVKDSTEQSYELYLDGFEVFLYTDDGLLETQITSEGARHTTTKGAEEWCAYGNVNIVNHIKGERIQTDTLYWNKDEHKIHTNCYVIATSPQGRMQGYGMESDEKARNSIINRPFDSFGVVTEDSTKFFLDTVNFVGPVQRF